MLEFLKKNVTVVGNDEKTEEVKAVYTISHEDLVVAATNDIFANEHRLLNSRRDTLDKLSFNLDLRQERLDVQEKALADNERIFQKEMDGKMADLAESVELAKQSASIQAFNEVHDEIARLTTESAKFKGEAQSLNLTVQFLEAQVALANERADKAQDALNSAFGLLASKMEQKTEFVHTQVSKDDLNINVVFEGEDKEAKVSKK